MCSLICVIGVLPKNKLDVKEECNVYYTINWTQIIKIIDSSTRECCVNYNFISMKKY